MDVALLLREAISAGRLREPFSAAEATRALGRAELPFPRVQSFLVRHCQGNLASSLVIVERVAHGRYRLLSDGPRAPAGLSAAARAARARHALRGD